MLKLTVIKTSHQTSTQAIHAWRPRGNTLHGSASDKSLTRLGARAMNSDSKPTGFLGRRTKP